jgi:hypothetical protein
MKLTSHKRDEKPPLYFRRVLAGLAPTGEAEQTRLAKIPMGAIVSAEIKMSRSLPEHRRYWLMCSMVAINHEQLQDAESVHQALKLLTGWTDKIALRSTGEIIQVPRSISFSKMTPDEWDAYYARAKQAVCEHLLPGVEIRELQDEILRLTA